jgi:hypothetical protein
VLVRSSAGSVTTLEQESSSIQAAVIYRPTREAEMI